MGAEAETVHEEARTATLAQANASVQGPSGSASAPTAVTPADVSGTVPSRVRSAFGVTAVSKAPFKLRSGVASSLTLILEKALSSSEASGLVGTGILHASMPPSSGAGPVCSGAVAAILAVVRFLPLPLPSPLEGR